MKVKWMAMLAGIPMLLLNLFGGNPLAVADPQGELKIADAYWGNEVPIPFREMTVANNYLKLLYDPLVGSYADGRLSTEHGVANKWEMTHDARTWTFYLRKGIKFHDGVELTAKDVKFSIEQIIRPDSQADSAILRSLIGNIEVKEPYTLVVQLKIPSILLPYLLSDAKGVEGLVQPKESFERVGSDQFISRPIGSGPYKWHSHLSRSYIKLEANDRHWRDGVPRYKYVTFLTIPEESTQIAMLRTGEVDIIRIGREKVEELLKAGFNVISKRSDSLIVLQCNRQWESPAFSDVRFRKALNLAINKEDIIKYIFGGRARPYSAYPGSYILACGGDPNLKAYPYDPQEARRLIKEAGYEGHEFTVASYPRPGVPEYQRVVESVVGYWEKIGLKPKIFMTDWNAWREKWRSGKTAGSVHGYNSTIEPGCPLLLRTLMRDFHSKSSQAITRDQKLTELLDRGSRSLDMGELLKIFGDIHRYVHDQQLIVNICELDDEIATNKRIPQWDPGKRRNERNFNDLIRQR